MKTLQVLILFSLSIAFASAQQLRSGVHSASLTEDDEVHRVLTQAKKPANNKKPSKKPGTTTGAFQTCKNLAHGSTLKATVADFYERCIVAAVKCNNNGEGSTSAEIKSIVKRIIVEDGIFFLGEPTFTKKVNACVSKNYISNNNGMFVSKI